MIEQRKVALKILSTKFMRKGDILHKIRGVAGMIFVCLLFSEKKHKKLTTCCVQDWHRYFHQRLKYFNFKIIFERESVHVGLP